MKITPVSRSIALMTQYLLMFAFSLYLISYGLIALFKKEWIWKLREFSARVERKDKFKRDEDHIGKIDRMGNIMAIIALTLGVIGFVMNVMLIAVTSQ
jgi:hypothetical protein